MATGDSSNSASSSRRESSGVSINTPGGGFVTSASGLADVTACGGIEGISGGREEGPSGHEATIDGDGLPGEVGGLAGAGVQDGFGDLLRCAGAVLGRTEFRAL